jgi:hypothetical protein
MSLTSTTDVNHTAAITAHRHGGDGVEVDVELLYDRLLQDRVVAKAALYPC